MTNKKIITIAFGVVAASVIAGHFVGAMWMLSAITLPILAAFVLILPKNIPLLWQSILVFLLIALHDIGTKLYCAGMHDGEGLGWVNMIVFITAVQCFVILAIAAYRTKNESKRNRVIAVGVFPVLMFFQFYFFGELGLGRYY
jgi:hypothetical protein